MKNGLINLTFRRNISLCVTEYSKIKPYRKGQYKERQKDDLWSKQKKMNPFVQNIGMARQLRSLNIDQDDPTFKTEHLGDMIHDFEGTLEGMQERSERFRDQHKVDIKEKKRIEKRRIIQKKVYPKPSNPNLLTWIEKEMIRYLHKMDPEEWTHERLSESFPATTSVIHKV